MDIQKEIELYKKYRGSKINNFGLQLSDFKNLDEYLGCLTWLNAKSQAVPEGFLLVSSKDLLDLTVAINAVDLATHTDNKTNEVREMWQDIAFRLIALGAQEQSHE